MYTRSTDRLVLLLTCACALIIAPHAWAVGTASNTTITNTAAVTAAGDDYFDDYMIEFQGTPMGVNVAADGASRYS